MKGIYHYCQFFCFFSTNTFLNGAGVRTMRNACRVQCDHTSGYIFAAHKITIYIIQYLIAVYIAMVVRCRNRLRMIIEQAGYKTAHYKVVGFKCLVYRRWLMHPAGNRLEIVYAKGKWITTAVPAHY